MTCARIAISLLLLASMAAAPDTQPKPVAQTPLPRAADMAREQFLQSMEKAGDERDALIDKARKQFDEKQSHLKAAYIEKLDQAIAAETKRGNLESALAIRTEKSAWEGGASAGSNPASSSEAAMAIKTGLLMLWEGKDGKFPFVRVVERLPPTFNRAARALAPKVPDGTPAVFQGFLRIKRDSETMILQLKADGFTTVDVDLDGQKLLKVDNNTDSREFLLNRGLHSISIRFAGDWNSTYQLLVKRTGMPFGDYVFDANELTGKQIVK